MVKGGQVREVEIGSVWALVVDIQKCSMWPRLIVSPLVKGGRAEGDEC